MKTKREKTTSIILSIVVFATIILALVATISSMLGGVTYNNKLNKMEETLRYQLSLKIGLSEDDELDEFNKVCGDSKGNYIFKVVAEGVEYYASTNIKGYDTYIEEVIFYQEEKIKGQITESLIQQRRSEALAKLKEKVEFRENFIEK